MPCLPPRNPPDPGIEPASLTSLALAGGFFTSTATWEGPPLSCLQVQKACAPLPKALSPPVASESALLGFFFPQKMTLSESKGFPGRYLVFIIDVSTESCFIKCFLTQIAHV